jgi:hypothetical protein
VNAPGRVAPGPGTDRIQGMRDWILLAAAVGAALAATARAQSDGGTGPAPVQIVVVPEQGGAPLASDAPVAGNGGSPGVASGEPDAGAQNQEEIILLVPKKPPPPPEPPKQIKVTILHTPRPRVEWGQASLELGISTGAFIVASAAVFIVELVPIFIADRLFNATPVAIGMVDVFALADAIALPFASTIAIGRVKDYSRHYELEGLGWWATYGTGLALQLVSAAITAVTLDANNFDATDLMLAPHRVVFGILTPISQTVVAQVLATPRDPLAPLEGGMARASPVLLDPKGRPIPIVRLVSFAF